jgi:HSP20 family protein
MADGQRLINPENRISHFRTLEFGLQRLIYGTSERCSRTGSGEKKMNVILRNRAYPVLQVRPFDSSFERLVGSLLENAPLAPRMNVVDTGAAYRIEAELPGVTREEIRISVDRKRVSVEAEASAANGAAEGEKALLTERTSRKYSRALTLGGDVNEGEAVAKFENGVLTLTLPKKAADQPRQIAVQ